MASSGVRVVTLSAVANEVISSFSASPSVSRNCWKLGKRFRYLMSMRSGGEASTLRPSSVMRKCARFVSSTSPALPK